MAVPTFPKSQRRKMCAQFVTSCSRRLGHGEVDHAPPVVEVGRLARMPDHLIPGRERREREFGERITPHTSTRLGHQPAALLEPKHRRANTGSVNAELGHQFDRSRDRNPITHPSRDRTEEADQKSA